MYLGAYYAVQLSRSFKVTEFGTNRNLIYNILLVSNTNLPPILHHFHYRDIAFDKSKIAIFGYPSCIYPPPSTSLLKENYTYVYVKEFSPKMLQLYII